MSAADTEAKEHYHLTPVTVEVCPNPVFVIGSPRSGTSVLPWSMAHHWDFCTFQETEFIHGIFDQADGVYKAACKDSGTFVTQHGLSHAEFFGTIGLGVNALISRYSEGQRWVDQTPGYTTMAWVLAGMFPGASFIHVLRDGRAVVNSMINFGNRPNGQAADLQGWATDFTTAVETWKHYVEFAMNFCEGNPGRTLTVRNEDLVERTEDEFHRIFDFLGAPYNTQPAEFFRRSRVNSSFDPTVWGTGEAVAENQNASLARAAKAWSQWTPDQRATFNDIAGDLLHRLGYPDLD